MLVVPKQRRSSKAAPPARDAAPDASPDENRGPDPAAAPVATVAAHAHAPAVAPPPKRARTASGDGAKSFDGAKNFIAQLQKAERDDAAPAVAPLRPARADATARASAGGGAQALADAAEADARTRPGPARDPAAAAANLDEFEEDAIHVLSGLFEEETPSQALSDAGTAHGGAPKRRRSSVSKPAGAGAGAGAGSERGDRDVSDVGKSPGAGPSASRKAADHRRLLKSYMKALFRHVKLPVDNKNADATTYRDRINNALAYWFGECFAPGRAVVECNAPKILSAVVYLATYGRVKVKPGEVGEIMRKGLQAKNANYTVNDVELRRRGVADDELRALFEGPSRIERGYPRGLPLILPNLDQLPPPIEGGVGGNGDGDGRKTAAKAGGRVGVSRDADERTWAKVASPPRPAKGARSKRERGGTTGNGNASGAGSNAGAKTPTPTTLRATADAAEDAGETAGETETGNGNGTGTVPAEGKKTPGEGSPLFSPVGGVAVAFAAAALMPRVGDRSAAVVDFVERRVRPMIEEVEATASVETQLEMINCAQGELTRLAAALAREQHAAAAAAPGRTAGGDGKRKR
jgi:hypothetical protein